VFKGWKAITKMCRVFAVVFNQMGLFSAKEKMGDVFTQWRQQVWGGGCRGRECC
jgi:hypothetical protein